jgi:hypothetical protein
LFLDALSFELEALKAEVGHGSLASLDLCVVLTDFCPSNVDAWRSDPILAPHFASGLLDVGLLDCDASAALVLQSRGLTLDAAHPSANPLLALANYLFDSIPMDAFRVKGGALHEARVSTFCKQRPLDGAAVDPSLPGAIHQTWSYEPIDDPLAYYPGEEGLGEVLEWYRRHLPDGATFTFPVSGLRLIRRLQSWGASVALLIADKAHSRVRQLAARRGSPIVSLHGSLSMLVNLHAVGHYCASSPRAVALHTPHQNASLDVCFLHLGGLFGAAVPRATFAFWDQLALFSTCDLFTVRDHAEDVAASRGGATLPLVLSLLRLSRWDPDVLGQFAHTVLAATAAAWDPTTRRAAAALLASIPHLKHSPRFDRDGALRATCDAVEVKLKAALAPRQGKLLVSS